MSTFGCVDGKKRVLSVQAVDERSMSAVVVGEAVEGGRVRSVSGRRFWEKKEVSCQTF